MDRETLKQMPTVERLQALNSMTAAERAALRLETLMDFVTAIGTLVFLCPNYAIAQTPDGREVELDGPTVAGWRSSNRRAVKTAARLVSKDREEVR